MKNNKKGFTIVELVIVIAVIAILAAVLIPTFSTVIANARETAAMEQANTTKTAVLVLSNGSISDGSTFYILSDSPVEENTAGENVTSDKIGDVNYAYKFENGKLTRTEELSAKEVVFGGKGAYTVFVSAKYLNAKQDGLVTDGTATPTDVDKQVVAKQIESVIGFTAKNIATATTADYITLTYTEITWTVTGEADPETVTVNVYYSSDILDTSIAFMHQEKA